MDKRWHDFWEKNPSSTPRQATAVRSRLSKRYQEPHRGYHNLRHIEFCLREFDRSRQFAANPMVVEMAIWFHDIIYNPKLHDNEAQSARLAGIEIKRLGGTDDFIHAVQCAILATVHDGAVPASHIDDRLVCDIDLSGLAQPWDDFARDGINIRKEYSHVPETDFRKGRVNILQMFHDRKPLYYLPFFQERYEEHAKSNLARAINELMAMA